MNINNLKYISQKEIKEQIHKFIERELDSNNLIQTLTPATVNIIENIAAGAASFMIYNSMMMKNERFLSTAILHSSIFNLARDYSYNMSRAVSPKLELIYNSTETRIIQEGESLGSYKGLDAIYFGKNITVEKGDKVQVSLGKVFKIKERAKLTNESLIYQLEPSILESVDNEQIKLYVNKQPVEISKLVEDFAVWNSVVDFSSSNKATKLMVCDNQFKYGKYIFENDLIEIIYMETDGYINNFEMSELKIDEHFLVSKILTNGVKPEPIEKIREIAPLFYTTQRRMVNIKDHIYIATSNPYFKSVGYKKDAGIPLKVKIKVTDTTKATYVVYIDHIPYTYSKKGDDTKESITANIASLLNHNSQVSIAAEKEVINVTARDSRNETEVEVSESLEKLVTVENKKPPCCSVFLYYVMHNVVDNPITLTPAEEESVADFLEKYKFEGVRIILLPASKITKDIDLTISVTNAKYCNEITARIKEIIAQYELKVETEFLYGDMLAQIAQIEVIDVEDGEVKKPIQYILPNQETFDILPSPDNYIKFGNVTVNYTRD